jgi:hypothetical protein
MKASEKSRLHRTLTQKIDRAELLEGILNWKPSKNPVWPA